MPTINVLDAAKQVQTINTIPNPGPAPSAQSVSVVLSTDHGVIPVSNTVLGALADPAVTDWTQNASAIGLLKGIMSPQAYDENTGMQLCGNMRVKWKEGFGSKDAAIWTFNEDPNDLVWSDGNVGGGSYLVISKSALVPTTSTNLISKERFKIPSIFMAGLGLSQRTNAGEFSFEFVAVDGNGVVVPPDDPVPAAVVVSSIDANNADWVVVTATPHGLLPGRGVVLYDNADSRANVGPLYIKTVPSPTSLTFAATDHNAALAAGGMLRGICECGLAKFAGVTRFIGTSASNAESISRNGQSTRIVNWNPGNTQTDSVVPSEHINFASVPYVRAFRAKGEWNMWVQTEDLLFVTKDQDGSGDPRSSSYRRSEVPDFQELYALRFRANHFENMSKPVANIVSISKVASTTATIVFDQPHGLTTTSYILIYGVRDATNFANLTTATPVASVVDPTTITIAFGASATATSYGGFAFLVNGSNNGSIESENIQSYLRTADNRLEITALTAWAEVIGNTVTLFGLVHSDGAVQTALHGRYRVANRIDATFKLELEPLDSQDISGVPLSATNAGGTVIRNTDYRLHYAKVLDYVRSMVEVPHSGVEARSVPVNVNSTVTVTASNLSCNLAQVAGQTTISGGTNGSLAVGGTAAHDAAMTANPVALGGNARSTNYTAVADNDVARLICDTVGKLIVQPYAQPELVWSYPAAAGGIINTADNAARAAAGAGIRTYVTWLTFQNVNAVATEFVVKDGASTVLHRGYAPANMLTAVPVPFLTPLRGTANTALNVAAITTGAQLYLNLGGYNAP